MIKRHDNHNWLLITLVAGATIITAMFIALGCNWIAVPFTLGLAAVGLWKDLL
jgi:hypothetical protein